MDDVKFYYSYVNRITGKLWGEPVRMTETEADAIRADASGMFMKRRGYKLEKIPTRMACSGDVKKYEKDVRISKVEKEIDSNMK